MLKYVLLVAIVLGASAEHVIWE